MNVVIADSKPEVRSALRLLVSQDPELTVVAEAHDVASLLATTDAHSPELVLVDWELADPRPAGARGGSLTDEIAASAPQARVIVLCGRPEARSHALAAGADAFVCKGDTPDRLIDALHTVSANTGRD